MSQLLLSILIPTVVGRKDDFDKLCSTVINQVGLLCNANNFIQSFIVNDFGLNGGVYDNLVEVVWCIDDKSITIGEKREVLYKYSKGRYSWQIDDDDEISPNAIELILDAIKNNPDVDCITFEEHIDIDGKIQRSNHSLKYDDWANNQDGYDYVRTPFMKSVIKTEIARSVPIPHIRFGEDHQWAQRLKPCLKTEVHIPQQIYRYIHRSSNTTERYGLDRS